jgi:hypothetical protein
VRRADAVIARVRFGSKGFFRSRVRRPSCRPRNGWSISARSSASVSRRAGSSGIWAAALKPTKVPHKPTLPYTCLKAERLLESARALVGFGQYGPRSSR